MLQLTARLERMNQYVGRGQDLGIPAEQMAAAEAVIEALKRVPGAAPVTASSPQAPPQQGPTPAESQPEAGSPTEQVRPLTDCGNLQPFHASGRRCCHYIASSTSRLDTACQLEPR